MPPLFAVLSSFLLLLVIVTGACGFGRSTLLRFFGRQSDPFEESILAAALGLGMLAYLILALAAARMLYATVLWSVLLLMAVMALREALVLRRACSRQITPDISPWPAFCGLLILIAGGIVITTALAPPVFYDTLVYHYAAPDLYLRHHRLLYLPELLLSNYPFTLEMLHTFSLGLTGWPLANLLVAAQGLLSGAAVYALAARAFGRTAGLIAATVFLTSASVMELSTLATGDMGVALFNTLALLCLLRWQELFERRWLVLAGVLVGLAMGVKYTAMALCCAPACLLVIGMALAARRGAAVTLRDLALFLLVALLVFSPWLIRNLIFTGNPLYPFLAPVFQSPDITPTQYAAALSDANRRELARMNPLDLSHALFRLALNDPSGGPASALGFAFTLFVPLALLLPRKPAALKGLLAYGALCLGIWALTTNLARFLAPVLGVLAAIVGYTVARCDAMRPAVRIAARGVLIATLAASLAVFCWFNPVTRDTWLAGAGVLPEEQYLARYLPLMETARWANQALPRETRLLFLGETRGFPFDRDRICPSAFDDNPLEVLVRTTRDPAAVAAGLRALGVTHIVYTPSEAARLDRSMDILKWSPADEEVFSRFLREQTHEVHRGPVAVILALHDTAAP